MASTHPNPQDYHPPLDATHAPEEVASQPVLDATTTPDTTEPTKPGLARHVDEYSRVMAAAAPASNPLQAFAAKPLGTSFDSQLQGETVLLLLRQSIVTQLKWVFVVVLLALLPFVVSVLPIFGSIPAQFSLLATVGWYLIVLGFTLETFLNWFYNVYIITDERIIDVDFNSLLFKNVSSAQLENIEDITATTSGTLGAVFNFGTISIQTSAAVTQFEFAHVPNPSQVTAFINELLLEEKREELEGRVR